MNTPSSTRSSLRERLDSAPPGRTRWLCDGEAGVSLDELRAGTSLDGGASPLAGRAVLVATRSQLAAALGDDANMFRSQIRRAHDQS